ncbi:uL15 family ribosomal protein [Candidatus Hecatella orcuttiae]|uniref:uL15 family ribosomal protein n=1 Tax=Candidatus Hecatella orcuttiae TaxID=1935119 RepID=UPI0028681E4C|nr:uL15 family ribosomal protein [Candidatus Hecatella orcuttiae]
MPHKLRKTRKLRGSRTHGWGQVGQHRKHGMKGGRGKAGLHKHGWTYVVKYEPEYFSKKGFRCPTGRGQLRALNVGELGLMVEDLLAEGKLKADGEKVEVDLLNLGYEKILGEGKVNRPLVVKAPYWSKAAEKKIVDAGGALIKVKG